MGSEQCACCDDNKIKSNGQLPPSISAKKSTKTEPIVLPPLQPKIQKHINQLQPFRFQLAQNINKEIVLIGNDFYEGKLNHRNRPQGYGKMYYQNGNLFIGQFQNGLASGPGYFLFVDGSYYHGNMTNNKADTTNGQFVAQQFTYKGGLKNNQFNGFGEEVGREHSYKGNYKNGKKFNGQLSWVEREYDSSGQAITKIKWDYIGQFNQNEQFEGQGTLTNDYGVYKGQFKAGFKNGMGQFQFNVGIKYVGNYVNDIRQGQGTIYTKTNSIAFCGQLRNGLPHGKGYVVNSYGDKVTLNWIQGLDQRLLEKNKSNDQQSI